MTDSQQLYKEQQQMQQKVKQLPPHKENQTKIDSIEYR